MLFRSVGVHFQSILLMLSSSPVESVVSFAAVRAALGGASELLQYIVGVLLAGVWLAGVRPGGAVVAGGGMIANVPPYST